MNRLDQLFQRKQNNILSVYFTGGFPTLDSTVPVIRALADGGIDMIEVGIPFSDPMADGKVIQESSSKALRNGMTLALLMEQVEEARRLCPDIPLVMMGYLNPILSFGPRRFFERCSRAGVDAMIIPDLPFDEYMRDYKELCEEFNLRLIMLITPETSDERIHLIDDNCSGFIYMVSAAATTGTRQSFGPEQHEYFRRIDALSLKHRRLIGFGISNHATMADACAHSSGAIIGSKFIKCLEATSTPEEAVEALLASLRP